MSKLKFEIISCKIDRYTSTRELFAYIIVKLFINNEWSEHACEIELEEENIWDCLFFIDSIEEFEFFDDLGMTWDDCEDFIDAVIERTERTYKDFIQKNGSK